uniref:Uncharacterized protein n=1 Tax=Rhizophora mucronata TaxID=61149 RepID=A0A2P2P522_RHIMU
MHLQGNIIYIQQLALITQAKLKRQYSK